MVVRFNVTESEPFTKKYPERPSLTGLLQKAGNLSAVAMIKALTLALCLAKDPVPGVLAYFCIQT